MSNSKGPITCHVLDVATGKPAEGVEVNIQSHQKLQGGQGLDIFSPFAHGTTNADGRCMDMLPPRDSDEARFRHQRLEAGIYKIVFKPKEYYEKTGRKCFYPWVEVAFEVENPEEHYHIPLLISPYSFTTYRGS